MTETEAIEKSIAQWEYLAEHGCDKSGLPANLKAPDENWDCFLCEYAGHTIHATRFISIKDSIPLTCAVFCPYYKTFGMCADKDMPYTVWDEVEDEESGTPTQCIKLRKQRALPFLNQLKSLLKKE